MVTTNQDKLSIRHHIIQQRKQLTKQQQQQRSQQIAKHLYQHKYFIHAQNIAYYLPISGEADPTLLQHSVINTAHSNNKTFYLPIVAQQGENSLLFAKVHKKTDYKKNKYSIKEPIYHTKDLLPAKQLDIVIMPLVAFDHLGNRLGMGGGYYDRTFAFKAKKNQKSIDETNNTQETPILIGYAYNFQQVAKIDAERWDIPLDSIVTESGIRSIAT